MLRIWVSALIIGFVHISSCAQELHKNLGITLETAAKTGWWIYHKGGTVAGKNDNGWDRTHYNFKLNIGAGLQYQVQKLSVGIFYSHAAYLEDEMLKHEDFIPQRKKYEISKRAVTFEEFGISLAYDLINVKNFTMSPRLGVGKFQINSRHPDQSQFDQQYFWNLGFENKIDYRKVTWSFAPQYQEMTIKTDQVSGAFHKIHSFGINVSITYWINAIKNHENS